LARYAREMLRYCALLLTVLPASAVAQRHPMDASVRVDPTAGRQILERDWVLMNWALKFYDTDRDILLSPTEAQSAADAFRSMADANNDGRVTTDEYRAARQLILARY
jgi:hypothetical protein